MARTSRSSLKDAPCQIKRERKIICLNADELDETSFFACHNTDHWLHVALPRHWMYVGESDNHH